MEKRYFDPQLIWSLARERLLQEKEILNLSTHDPQILFYVSGTDGAYIVRAGKLYYDEDTNDQYFGNTKDKLSDLIICEIVIKCRHFTHAFKNYEKFIEWITKE